MHDGVVPTESMRSSLGPSFRQLAIKPEIAGYKAGVALARGCDERMRRVAFCILRVDGNGGAERPAAGPILILVRKRFLQALRTEQGDRSSSCDGRPRATSVWWTIDGERVMHSR